MTTARMVRDALMRQRDPAADPQPGDIAVGGHVYRRVLDVRRRDLLIQGNIRRYWMKLREWQKWCAETNPTFRELSLPSIEEQISELKAGGWSSTSPSVWKSPAGALYRGPHGAWKAMKAWRYVD